jgi:hypothetical protein
MIYLQRTTGNGAPRFDLAMYPADTDPTALDAQTLIYAVLYTDAQAPAGRVQDGRRGWWADPAAGTGLWYVRRQALDSAARREAIDMVRAARAARSPALTEISVADVTPAGTVSEVLIQVTGKHNGLAFSVPFAL